MKISVVACALLVSANAAFACPINNPYCDIRDDTPTNVPMFQGNTNITAGSAVKVTIPNILERLDWETFARYRGEFVCVRHNHMWKPHNQTNSGEQICWADEEPQ